MSDWSKLFSIIFSADVESVQINEETVNPKEKIGPEDFELLKVLGKGGYGKVCLLTFNFFVNLKFH